mgnify:CR=1 FL=1
MSNIFQWQLHGDGKTLQPGEVVEPDERLTWTRTAGIGAQHVIACLLYTSPSPRDS